jgi:hypothetical protein
MWQSIRRIHASKCLAAIVVFKSIRKCRGWISRYPLQPPSIFPLDQSFPSHPKVTAAAGG